MIWLVDGRSGAGKTAWARRMGRILGWPVTHIEDAYPGWDGLAAGSATVARDMLDPARPGFRRWDWHAGGWAGWVDLEPLSPRIIEGCGAITAETVAAARELGDVWAVWVDCPTHVRHGRAMARDPHYGANWGRWAAQEDAHISGNNPRGLADWILDGEKYRPTW